MTTTIHKTIAIAALLAGGMLLSGCSLLSEFLPADTATRDEETEEITEEGSLDVFTLAVGDCLTDTVDDADVSQVPVVPCSEEHDGEVFFEFEVPDGDFPGDDALAESTYEQCDVAFESFVGVAYDDSALDYGYFTPTESSWSDLEDRLVQCYVYDPSGKTIGSLEGAAR